MLIAAGLSISFYLQAFIIIAGVTKFLPLTGITLPFISYGGSNFVTNMAGIGLVLNVVKNRSSATAINTPLMLRNQRGSWWRRGKHAKQSTL